ncbi:MAG: rhomboid family intramembrane serine protease [Planctomycetaceae bacterium]
MGLYDREYYRNDAQSGGGWLKVEGSVVKQLIAVNVAVFVLQLLTWNRGGGVTDWLDLKPDRVVGRFEIWRLLTYAFCHDPRSAWHIVGNMLFLWICGRPVEPIYGPREFLRFYLTASVFSGLCYTAFCLLTNRLAPSLGASGAVMAVTMLCALYFPTQEILLFFVIPVQLRWLVVLFVIFDLHPLLMDLGGGRSMSRVAHAAHLGGLLYGYLYKRFDLRWGRLLADVRLPRWRRLIQSTTGRRPSVKIYQPPREKTETAELKQQVDRLLAKISEQGEGSLTDAERDVLKEASRRYKRQ